MRVSVTIGEPPGLEGWVNIAPGKSCAQSSLSKFSRPEGAAAAVAPVMAADYAIHTSFEAGPWWRIDLGAAYAELVLVVFNRRAASYRDEDLRARVLPLRVEIAEDGEAWATAALIESPFGDARSGRPLCLRITADAAGPGLRHLRLTAEKPRTALHLQAVQVFATVAEAAALDPGGGIEADPYQHFHTLIGTDHAYATARASYVRDRLSLFPAFDIPRIDTIRVPRIGRLGNRLVAAVSALTLAERLGVGRVFLDFADMRAPFAMPAQLAAGGLSIETVLPPSRPEGGVMEACFFYGRYLPRGVERAPETFCQVLREIAPRLFFPNFRPGALGAGRVVAHIRSGDLFAAEGDAVHPGYVQPPLAYYQACLEHAAAQAPITEVVVVFEDRGNPVVNALEAWLDASGVAFRMQSGTLAEDVGTLYAARRVIAGHGTFVPAILAASTAVEAMYFFRRMTLPHWLSAVGARLFVARDEAGEFTPYGAWRNSAEQRALMLAYPLAGLRVGEA